jgi:hypothetical protein
MKKDINSFHSPDPKMHLNSRREFLADVGRGMLISSVGSTLAFDLGLTPVFADEGTGRLSFGKLEPLVGLMQETPPGKLQRQLVEKIKAGTDLRTLVAAGALANARTFGGQDYVGFHTIMALAPAFEMARELPEALRPLPVLRCCTETQIEFNSLVVATRKCSGRSNRLRWAREPPVENCCDRRRVRRTLTGPNEPSLPWPSSR